MLIAKDRLRLSSELRLPSDLANFRGLPFLERNINRFLEHEEQRVRSRGSVGLAKSSLDNTTHQSSWQYPLEQMSDLHDNEPVPVLKVDVCSLKRAPKDQHVRARADKRAKLYDVKCYVELNIRIPRLDISICDTQKPAKLIGRIDENGSLQFDVKLSEAFRVPIEQLSSALDENQPHTSVFREQFQMQLKFTFCSMDDGLPFLRKILGNGSNAIDRHGRLTSLRASWMGLPRCPTKDEPLCLMHVLGENELKTKYKLKVDMNWNKRNIEPISSPLQEVQVRSRALQDVQLPTPVSESPAPQDVITVQYCERDSGGEMRIRSLDGFSCEFCGGNGNADFPSYERLQHHLINRHPKTNFEFWKDEMTSGYERHILVRIDVLPSRTRSRESSVDSILSVIHVDLDWQRPLEPYQASQHAKGKQSWEPKVTKRNKAKPAPAPQKAKHKIKRADPEVPLTLGAKPPAPPRTAPKLHTVPRPGKKIPILFRTKSRRIISQDDLLDESDLEADVEWTVQGIQYRLRMSNEADIPYAARELSAAVNQYVREYHNYQDPLTYTHLTKFAVSYAKSNGLSSDPYTVADWLAISRKVIPVPDSRLNIDDVLFWWKKAPGCKGKGSVSSAQNTKSCTASVQAWRESENRARNVSHRGLKRVPRHSIPDSEVDEPIDASVHQEEVNSSDLLDLRDHKDHNSRSRDQRRKSLGDALPAIRLKPIYNQEVQSNYCVCGQLVASFARTVICANDECKTQSFHMRCVGLTSRPPSWLCLSCRQQRASTTEEETR